MSCHSLSLEFKDVKLRRSAESDTRHWNTEFRADTVLRTGCDVIATTPLR